MPEQAAAITMILADDHNIIREALATLCASHGFRILGQCSDGGRAFEMIQSMQPDFALLDMHMPVLSGVEVIRKLRATGCSTKLMILSISRDEAESRYQAEPADAATPERIYERRWALALLDQVLARLEDEYRQSGKTPLFARLKLYLVADEPAARYADVAADLGVSEGAVKVAVHRLRRRYGEILRAEVARTLERPADVKEEIQALFAALRQ